MVENPTKTQKIKCLVCRETYKLTFSQGSVISQGRHSGYVRCPANGEQIRMTRDRASQLRFSLRKPLLRKKRHSVRVHKATVKYRVTKFSVLMLSLTF